MYLVRLIHGRGRDGVRGIENELDRLDLGSNRIRNYWINF